MTRKAFWFGPDGEQFFGWLHLPETPEVRGGVVICPPLGEEYKATHRTMRQLAESLEAEGFATLRFDYRGTGDSPGQPTVHRWVEQCQQDIQVAVDTLRESGLHFVVVVGMRMGATLAASAFRGDSQVEGLVLWDPCDSSRTFLREQLLLQAMTGKADGGEIAEGWLDCPESIFPEDFVVDLVSPTGQLPNTVRALVLTRVDRPVHPTVRQLVEQLSADEGAALGQSGLLDVASIVRTVPSAAIQSILSWIAALTTPTVPTHTLTFKDAASRGVVGVKHGNAVSESTVRFGEGELFGILTEGDWGSIDRPAVLLLSVANDHRAATGRVWVDLARELAWFGFRSLRLDLSGMGDSGLRTGQAPQIIRAISHLDDVKDAAVYLSRNDPANVVLVGLSSSAYLSLESGFEIGVRTVCAINADLFFIPPEMAPGLGDMDGRRRFCFPPPASWTRLRRRPSVSWLGRKFPSLSWRFALLLRTRSSPMRRLGELVSRGTGLLLVGGERENLILRQSSPRLYRALSRRAGVRLVTIGDLEHHLPAASDRSHIRELVRDFIVKSFG